MGDDDTGSTATSGVTKRDAIAERLERYLEAESAYLRQEDDDPEKVHDVRVAARRLRAALGAAGSAGKGSWRADLRRAVKRAGGALGPVRDADVQLAMLEAERANAAPEEAPGIDRLVARLKREQASARERALAALGEPGIRKPMAKAERRLANHGDAPPASGSRKDRLARRSKQADLIEARLDALLASAETSREAETPEAMHDHRIAAKRLRYTIELDLDRLGEPGESAVETLKAIQDELGELHDIDVLLALARDELRAVADEESAAALAGETVPAENMDRAALLAFMTRVAKDRAGRAAAFATHWSEMVAGGLEARIRALATGIGERRDEA